MDTSLSTHHNKGAFRGVSERALGGSIPQVFVRMACGSNPSFVVFLGMKGTAPGGPKNTFEVGSKRTHQPFTPSFGVKDFTSPLRIVPPPTQSSDSILGIPGSMVERAVRAA